MQPLAERLRPRTLDEYIGQKHLVGPGAVLRKMIDAGRISSFILWGPPGVGKTTLAQIIANKLDKIKKSQLEGNIAEIRQTLLLPEEVPVIPFSAEKGFGRDEVLNLIFEHVCGKEEA